MNSAHVTTNRGKPALQSTRLLDQVRERIRYLHYSLRTEQAYLLWIRAFVRHHGLRHPRTLGGPEVESFLNALVNQCNISASTHKQALCALLFLYREVLDQDLPWMQQIQRPAIRKHVPAVLTVAQTRDLLDRMQGEPALVARVLYGCGLRLTEALKLRVKDVDFERHVLIVRSGKGGKDRVVMLPRSLVTDLHAQMARARAWWEQDRKLGRRVWRCRTRSPVNTLRAAPTGAGTGCSPPITARAIRAAAPSDVSTTITWRSASWISRFTYLSITRMVWPASRSSRRQRQISSRISGAGPRSLRPGSAAGGWSPARARSRASAARRQTAGCRLAAVYR